MSATGGSVEESLTWQQLRDKMDGARIPSANFHVVRVDSTGLHVVVDWNDRRARAYLLTDLGVADPAAPILDGRSGGTLKASVLATNELSNAAGVGLLAVRIGAAVPSSTNIGQVGIVAGSAILASQNGVWTVGISTATLGIPAPAAALAVALAKDASSNLQYLPLVSGVNYTSPVPVVLDVTQTNLNDTLNVAVPGTVNVSDRAARLAGQVGLGTADSIQSGGRVAGPAAGANISGNVTAAAKTYLLYCSIDVDGTVAIATDDANMGLFQNAVKLTTLAYDATNLASVMFGPFRITAANLDTFSVRAIGNATATANYMATIWAIPQT